MEDGCFSEAEGDRGLMEGFCRALLSLCDFWAASITSCVVDFHCLIGFVV